MLFYGLIDDVGDPTAPRGSASWARYCRAHLGILIGNEHTSVHSVYTCLMGMEETEGYRQLLRSDGEPFASLQEFAKAPRPFGLGFDSALDTLLMVQSHALASGETLGDLRRRQEHTWAKTLPPLEQQGRHTRDAITLSNNMMDRGTSAPYRIRKLKRDAPAVCDAFARGEYPSLRAAEEAAVGGRYGPRAEDAPVAAHFLISNVPVRPGQLVEV